MHPEQAAVALKQASMACAEATHNTIIPCNMDDPEKGPVPGWCGHYTNGSNEPKVDEGVSEGRTLRKETGAQNVVGGLPDFGDQCASREYLEQLLVSQPFPNATGPLWLNLCRYRILSTYRRLFILVLFGNLVALLYCIRTTLQGLGRVSYRDATTAVGANLFVATLMRHEHWINLLFRCSVAIPRWLPLFIRRLAAKVYSYGGVHSACGIGGLGWYMYFTALFALQTEEWTLVSKGIVVLSGGVLLNLTVLVAMSYPGFRARYHNQWELYHRYCGWVSIAAIWAQIVLIICSTPAPGVLLAKTPAFWFLLATTCLIVYPWLHLRRVSYTAEHLSSHAIRLWVNEERVLPLTVGIRLSDAPLRETHGFATIPNEGDEPGYSVLISNAGDWTKRVINEPSSSLWARGAFTIGVLRVAVLFRPLVLVATGSGIGPCLSFLQKHRSWPVHVVWSARQPHVTYGARVLASVFSADPNAIIIDTKATGKSPDLVHVVYAIYRKTRAEAVAIISNPKTTGDVVFALESRKIPAFGAIFDS